MIIAALLLAALPPFDIAQAEPLMRRHCASEWPENFQMQEYCLKMQVEGMGQFATASQQVGRPLDKALEQCVEEWTKAGVPDWSMIGYCAKQQAEAWLRLHPERG